MRWGLFIVAGLLAAALDTSLMGVLSVGGVAPQLSPLLVVFVALAAPRLTAMWAALLLGLVLDLCDPVMQTDLRPLYLAGPHALGYLFGVNLVLPLRTMVIRRNPLTLGVLTFLFSLAASLVVVTIWSVRGWYSDPAIAFQGGSALAELGRSALRAFYSGALAIPLGWILSRTAPLWGFTAQGQRSARW